MAVAGFISTCELVVTKYMKEFGWPYFQMMGCSLVIMALIVGSGLAYVSAKVPARHLLKWLFLRSAFGVGSFVLSVAAVQVGCPPGDVAALTSINMVLAALMGHLFLSEAVQCVHLGALVCSVAGAVCIARPQFLFGESEASGASWIGYVFAPAAGTFQACTFICARKGSDVSAWVTSFCSAMLAIPVLALLPFTPLVGNATLNPVMENPWIAVAFLACLVILTFAAITSNTAGSAMCPAAVSSTVYTATSMFSGYLAQTVLFDMAPEVVTLVGAALMLIAVVIMATARLSKSFSSEAPQELAESASSTADTLEVNDDDTESLASFISSEFAMRAPHEKSVRQRHSASVAEAGAQTIGSVNMVFAASA